MYKRQGETCGAPLTAIIENTNIRSQDYNDLCDKPRPAHADFTAQIKYGGHQDVRGGGHFSGRLTAPLCIAGGICAQLLSRRGIAIGAHIRFIAQIEDKPFDPLGEQTEVLRRVQAASFPVLDPNVEEPMRAVILQAQREGDSVGGVVECMVTGLPAGVGSPMFQGLESQLAAALFAIPAVKGVEFGTGFQSANLRGSENNDPFILEDGAIRTETNHAGGILGGISNGMPILFRVAFKPTPSIAQSQRTAVSYTHLDVYKRQVKEITDSGEKTVERKVFPGYVLVKMVLTDESWHLVHNVRVVVSMFGRETPVDLELDQVEAIKD